MSRPLWLVATREDSQRSISQSIAGLKSATSGLAVDVGPIDAPQDLRFRSFDELIGLLDAATRQEQLAESILKRLMRLGRESDGKIVYQIGYTEDASDTKTSREWVELFRWDDERFSRKKCIKELLAFMTETIVNADDTVRARANVYNEARQAAANLADKSTAPLAQQDLSDLMASFATDEAYINTKHFRSIPVIVPGNAFNDFEKTYENIEGCVPRSLIDKNIKDRDGTRVVAIAFMKGQIHQVIEVLRKNKIVAKDFFFDKEKHDERLDRRASAQAETTKQRALLTRACYLGVAEIFSVLVHIKVLRLFVNAVLEFGLPVSFNAAFILPPIGTKQAKNCWSAVQQELAPNCRENAVTNPGEASESGSLVSVVLHLID